MARSFSDAAGSWNTICTLRMTSLSSYLFIAHDLSVVRFISDRIGVIYKGRIVEVAEAEELFNFPLHPYTHSLISAIPIPSMTMARAMPIRCLCPPENSWGYLVRCSVISAIPIPDPQLEKNKVQYIYDPAIHDYSTDKPEFVDIGHDHWIYGNKAEIEKYKALREKGEPVKAVNIISPEETEKFAKARKTTERFMMLSVHKSNNLTDFSEYRSISPPKSTAAGTEPG